MPAEVDLKVVLVGQRVGGRQGLGHGGEDLLAHLVHCVLHAGALVLGKGLHCDVAGGAPRWVELGHGGADGGQVRELPGPGGVDVGGEDAVPGLGEGGVLVADEAVEGGAGGLEDGELLDGAGEGDAVLAGDAGLDVAGLLAVAEKGVRVRLAIDGHAGPAVLDDFDVRGVDVGVGLEEVGAEDGGEELRGVDGVLLRLDVGGVFDGVGGDDDAVVGDCVRGLDLALEQAADGHLGDGLDVAVLLDLVDADVVLAVAGGGEVGGHCESGVWI